MLIGFVSTLCGACEKKEKGFLKGPSWRERRGVGEGEGEEDGRRKKEGVERGGECRGRVRNLGPGSVKHKIKGVIYATRSKQQHMVA